MNNAIVIMFDSLQFNYLGCYGNTWIKTPNMDRLAREGVLFENCYTEGLPTVPCRRAMHTGRYTLHAKGWSALGMDDTTIADLCWGRPIDTALIFDCPMYRLPKFGYTRSFDKVWFTHGHEADDYFYEHDELFGADIMDYVDERTLEAYTTKVGESSTARTLTEITNYVRQQLRWRGKEDRFVAKTVRKAIEYLRHVDRNKQFFLWIDSFDPHEPWNPPSVYTGTPCPYDPDYQGKPEFLPFSSLVEGLYTEEQLYHVRMLYAELVTLCDEYLGLLMDALRELGFEQNTLLMMVSDHGEPMGNGADGHGLMRKVRPWPYEELAHTPLLLRAPGIKPGQRINAFVQSCDVAPTVCDWLGIGIHPDMHGKSLMPLARGEVKKVRNFAIAGYHKYSWAIFTEDWSYIHWLTKDDTSMISFYIKDMQTDHIDVSSTKIAEAKAKAEALGESVEARHQKDMTLDGEAQWTCTPGGTVEVPARDELYDRRSDPFQLNNVIDAHPDVAKKMFGMLREHMADLRAS